MNAKWSHHMPALGLTSLLFNNILRLHDSLRERILSVIVKIEYLVSLDGVFIIHDHVVKVMRLEIESLYFSHCHFSDVSKSSIVCISTKQGDDEVFIHEVEVVILCNGKCLTFLSLDLVDDLMIVDVWISWVSLHNFAHSVLLDDIVNEVSIIHEHRHLFKASSSNDISLFIY